MLDKGRPAELRQREADAVHFPKNQALVALASGNLYMSTLLKWSPNVQQKTVSGALSASVRL